MNDNHELSLALQRVNKALTAMRSGDPQPYIDCWANSPDATLFGAWGPMEHGAKAVTDTFRWVGSKFSGGHADEEHTVVAQETSPTRLASSVARRASVVGRAKKWSSVLRTSTGERMATGNSSTGTPTFHLLINASPQADVDSQAPHPGPPMDWRHAQTKASSLDQRRTHCDWRRVDGRRCLRAIDWHVGAIGARHRGALKQKPRTAGRPGLTAPDRNRQ